MRILVLSDIHSRGSVAEKIIAAHEDIKDIFFLGDGIDHIDTLWGIFPDRIFHSVAGNCDTFSFTQTSALEDLDGIRIFFTHGNLFGVKLGLARLKAESESRGVALTLFGHTHTPHSEYDNGIYYVNPGAAGSYPYHYAVIDITKGGIMPNLLTL